MNAMSSLIDAIVLKLRRAGYNACAGKYLEQVELPAIILTPIGDRFWGEQWYPNRPTNSPLQCDVLVTMAVGETDDDEAWYVQLGDLLHGVRAMLLETTLQPAIGADQIDCGPVQFADPRAGGRLGIAEMMLTLTYHDDFS